jgi:hypothetical protein
MSRSFMHDLAMYGTVKKHIKITLCDALLYINGGEQHTKSRKAVANFERFTL